MEAAGQKRERGQEEIFCEDELTLLVPMIINNTQI